MQRTTKYRRFGQLGSWLSLCLLAILPVLSHAGDLRVLLISSDDSPPYQAFATVLRNSLSASGIEIVESLPAGRKADLVVAAGVKAMEAAITNADAPILGVMIPRIAYETLLEKHSSQPWPKATSAIYLDQPWSRQLNFIQAALPKHSTIGVLYSPSTSIFLPRLPRGISINAQSVRSPETLFATLENILDNSDVLLVIPDSEIYSSSNVRNILLTSYRKKVPLVGISQAYVNAGALCAIFSTSEQIAEQTGKTIASFARDRRLPEPQYPSFFSIGLNQQVARSLGIILDSPEAIRERMDKAGEGRP